MDQAAADTQKPGSAAKTASGNKKKEQGQAPEFDRGLLSKFPKAHLDLLRVNELLSALDACGAGDSASPEIPAAIFDGTDIPRLHSDRRVAPIQDVDELLEVCGRVIEDATQVDDGERAIAGLVRLSTSKADDFPSLVAPLVKRAKTLLKRGAAPFNGQNLGSDLIGLICVWAFGGKVEITKKKPPNKFSSATMVITGVVDQPFETWAQDEFMPLSVLSKRSLEVARRLNDESWELLSAPTHEGGWIDARELVDRINPLNKHPDDADVILALLRLAPDDRTGALKKLKPNLKGEWVDAVTHALGGKVTHIGKSAPLWAAAARSRSPFDDDARIAKAFPKLGPGAANAAHFQIRYTEDNSGENPSFRPEIESTEKMPRKLNAMIPAQLMQIERGDGGISYWDLGTSADSVRWLASLWPAARDTFFAAGAASLFGNLDWWEAAWHHRCFLEPLLDADTPPRDIGMFMLLCGLAAKEPGEHGLAVDICIQAINDGRIGTDNLSRILAEHVSWQSFNLTRLAKRFLDIAVASDLHAYVVLHAWETALSHGLKEAPRGLSDIFELLAELGAELQRGIVNAECRNYLQTITGSNKTAKAARLLLAQETSFAATDYVQQAIAGRIERLKAWQTGD